ncbi:MAG: Rad52/Rad22 family DNA repair protein, partial [Nitrososphaerota archaeon]
THDVIRTANRIFGYGHWETEMPVPPMKVGHGYMSVMTVIVHLPSRTVKFTDAGYCDGDDETAIKGAVSDALKRCLRHFGPQFGLDLYAEREEREEHEHSPRQQRVEKNVHEIAAQITEIEDTRGAHPYPYIIRFIDHEGQEKEIPCFIANVDRSLTNAVVKLTVITSAKGNQYIKKIERL